MLSAETERGRRYEFGALYRPFFGKLAVSEITRLHVERFLKELDEVRKLAFMTKRRHLSTLESCFEWAIDLDPRPVGQVVLRVAVTGSCRWPARGFSLLRRAARCRIFERKLQAESRGT